MKNEIHTLIEVITKVAKDIFISCRRQDFKIRGVLFQVCFVVCEVTDCYKCSLTEL